MRFSRRAKRAIFARQPISTRLVRGLSEEQMTTSPDFSEFVPLFATYPFGARPSLRASQSLVEPKSRQLLATERPSAYRPLLPYGLRLPRLRCPLVAGKRRARPQCLSTPDRLACHRIYRKSGGEQIAKTYSREVS